MRFANFHPICERKSFPGNPWEHSIAGTNKNYTYYFPLTEEMAKKSINAYVLVNNELNEEIRPELWITAHPAPFSKYLLELE